MLSVCSETRILLIGFFRATDIMTQVSCWFLARHSPVAALAERSDRCKAEPQDRLPFSTNAQAEVANGFAAKALF